MIDFQVCPRGSGKTKYIVEQFKKTGGKIILPNFNHLMFYRHKYPEVRDECITVGSGNLQRVLNETKYLYFDEFLTQLVVNCDDLIRLDRPDVNIIVRTSDITHIPIRFQEYIKANYPEYCI